MADFHSDLKHIKKCIGGLYQSDIEYAIESLDDVIDMVGLLVESYPDKKIILTEILNSFYVCYHHLSKLSPDSQVPQWLYTMCVNTYDSLIAALS
jgi:hypothetical protein